MFEIGDRVRPAQAVGLDTREPVGTVVGFLTLEFAAVTGPPEDVLVRWDWASNVRTRRRVSRSWWTTLDPGTPADLRPDRRGALRVLCARSSGKYLVAVDGVTRSCEHLGHAAGEWLGRASANRWGQPRRGPQPSIAMPHSRSFVGGRWQRPHQLGVGYARGARRGEGRRREDAAGGGCSTSWLGVTMVGA